MDVTLLKIKLKEFLALRPGNLSAAAKEFNVSRSKIASIMEEFQEEFDEIDEAFLDDLEEQVINFARGRSESLSLKFNEALKILQARRGSRWGKRSDTKKVVSRSTGVAASMLKEFLNSKKEVEQAREENGTIRVEGEDEQPF